MEANGKNVHVLRVKPAAEAPQFALPPEVFAQLQQLEDSGRSLLGKLNIYTCDACRGHIVVCDIDTGVTPFMLGCKATPECKGMMKSSMYRVFDQDMAASHVFYRPTTTQFLDQATLQHVMQGGLLLREVTEAEKETY